MFNPLYQNDRGSNFCAGILWGSIGEYSKTIFTAVTGRTVSYQPCSDSEILIINTTLKNQDDEVVKRLTSELVEQNKVVARMQTKRNSLRQTLVGLRKKLKKKRKTFDEKMGYIKQFDDIQKKMSILEQEKATLFSQISIDF
jgi:hypothetical protein